LSFSGVINDSFIFSALSCVLSFLSGSGFLLFFGGVFCFSSSFDISTFEEVAGFAGLSFGFWVSSLFIFFSMLPDFSLLPVLLSTIELLFLSRLKSCLEPTKSSLFSGLEFSTVTFDSLNILLSSLFSP